MQVELDGFMLAFPAAASVAPYGVDRATPLRASNEGGINGNILVSQVEARSLQ